jgi:uncharacterized protein
MIVVSNTSPLVCLEHLQKLNLFENLFGNVIIPKSVYDELFSSKIINENFLQRNSFIKIKNPKNIDLVKNLIRQLDIGEAEAIALSIEEKPDFLIIDEAYGREIALSYNLPNKRYIGYISFGKRKKADRRNKAFN